MTAPKRRWLRWLLWTMFAGVTLLACWLDYELNWIRQRHELLNVDAGLPYVPLRSEYPWSSDAPQRAPGLQWLLGETGWATIEVDFHRRWPTPSPDGRMVGIRADQLPPLNDSELSTIEQFKRLFPEAEVSASH